MNENEQVLETFIKQQQEMISDLSQNNIMLKTKVEFLEKKLSEFDKFNKIIAELKRDKAQLQRKVESLSNNNKIFGDRVKNRDEQIRMLNNKVNDQQQQIDIYSGAERKKLINKKSISKFTHSGKVNINKG